MISVAMAAYNGEKYIETQIDSILCQLQPEDELVVSLDPSTDGTSLILQKICAADSRVRVIQGSGSGLMRNFENAIAKCRGEIIFLADQDDVWTPDKVVSCMECFSDDKVMVVVHDAKVLNGELEKVIYPSFFSYKGCRAGFWKNVLKNSYMGCCMAFRRELLAYALPFPKELPMHDQWIGLLGEKYGKSVFLEKQLLLYRRHENNMTGMSHAGVVQMLIWRFQIIKAVFLAKK